MFIHIPSGLIMKMRRPQTTEGILCFLWFGERNVDNFVLAEEADISKLGVSSSFQVKFSQLSTHWVLRKKIKKKGTFFSGHWDKVSLPYHYLEIWWNCEGG
ncbi:hypothetical protein TNIN_84651 [Trichonephila inaurata madagascariensis]|uniref:Uncharacterized protein n=1 Tax=Trichonephila inaurata madagascariensis TaxID=2747483 RepID=A0A8X7BQE6_9ARAC|nr:hypothetical protein TNIN_84651 [Trichonephila inaurata madagascariensis]